MLKAIWPSVARVPNHLSPDANITTVGTTLSNIIPFIQTCIADSLRFRRHVLLPLLASPVPFHAHLTPADQVLLHGQIHRRPNLVDSYISLEHP